MQFPIKYNLKLSYHNRKYIPLAQFRISSTYDKSYMQYVKFKIKLYLSKVLFPKLYDYVTIIWFAFTRFSTFFGNVTFKSMRNRVF